ncbi:hypothetical protein CRG98_045751 [Punica granatum]|uniref:Wall-associated receptor kinase galacturonan-binding domain-containing protein n=1 Tax=Punica granatum TaxID=22663 RepID=A0A2I0HRH5_PUNGR|nr:hypothetical protein CRG98_045751 [Punica granatum]
MGIVQLTLLVLLLLGSSRVEALAGNFPVAKAHCTDKCGDVTIPFPFGIGAGCFLDDWYEVVCQQGRNGTVVPWLKKIRLEVSNISLPDERERTDGLINVSFPITYSSPNCIDMVEEGPIAPTSLVGSSFIFSQTLNMFTAIGCHMRTGTTNCFIYNAIAPPASVVILISSMDVKTLTNVKIQGSTAVLGDA